MVYHRSTQEGRGRFIFSRGTRRIPVADKRDKGQLPHLDTFSKAAELGSFTGAAKALGMTQAAVSQRMHALEKMLRVSLFRRQGGRIFLTAAGQRLYDYAQRILALHRDAFEKIAGQKFPVSGELAVGASTIPGEHFLPAILSIFHQQYPNIQVRASI